MIVQAIMIKNMHVSKHKLREKEERTCTDYFKMIAMKHLPREPRVSIDSLAS